MLTTDREHSKKLAELLITNNGFDKRNAELALTLITRYMQLYEDWHRTAELNAKKIIELESNLGAEIDRYKESMRLIPDLLFKSKSETARDIKAKLEKEPSIVIAGQEHYVILKTYIDDFLKEMIGEE